MGDGQSLESRPKAIHRFLDLPEVVTDPPKSPSRNRGHSSPLSSISSSICFQIGSLRDA